MNALITIIQSKLQDAFSELSVLTQYDMEERESPYLLIESEALTERIKGNNTWEWELILTLSMNAHDTSKEQFSKLCGELSQFISTQLTPLQLNAEKRNYLIYSLRLISMTPPSVNEEKLSQAFTLNLLIQQ